MPKQKQRKKKMSKYIELDFAKLDIDRVKRRGYSETVFCECKTEEQRPYKNPILRVMKIK